MPHVRNPGATTKEAVITASYGYDYGFFRNVHCGSACDITRDADVIRSAYLFRLGVLGLALGLN